MGVPGFYSWLTKRYPMIKQMIKQQSLPQIDYLYLDMNGIIYKCVRDDSIIFKAQLLPRELEEIWIEIFNYINGLVNLLKPTKMILMALDGVAPRCKMNNQRSRRYRSAQDYKEFMAKFYGYTDTADSQENFKNNSISPGTQFMQQLNAMLHFFVQKKISQDDYWKQLSVIFTGSDTPGEGQHKIMQFVRANSSEFLEQDTHCFYGADADLIMLGLTLPIKNACIIREEYVHESQKVHIMSSRKEKEIRFELIYLNMLKECLDLEYRSLKASMKVQYDINHIARDFVFLFFFVGNDFLPRIYAYNIRQKGIQRLIEGFKNYLVGAQSYITQGTELNINELLRLLIEVGKYESQFFSDKHLQFERLLNREQQSFEDELQKQFLFKLQQEERTLLGLKQMYSNVSSVGRQQYYASYFNLDPVTHQQSLSHVLGYYVYGLKFVFEYYFRNLSSWGWYYPYYFAPLLSDLQYYLQSLLLSDTRLQQFDLGAPFQPFKQLLCILPKESADLLPENFQKYLLEPNSCLRTPIDFYPDSVESVTYGSVRSHQAISLIPFLDQSLICKVYDEEISRVPQEDLPRNILGNSHLYEYKEEAAPVQVESPFGSIQSFSCNIVITEVSLLGHFKWKSVNTVTPVDGSLLKMPSLYMRPFEFKPVLINKRDNRVETRFFIKLTTEPFRQSFKLGQPIFYGYPIEHSGRIQAILTRKDFFFISEIELRNYDRIIDKSTFSGVQQIKRNVRYFFDQVLDKLQKSNQSYVDFIDLTAIDTFLFIVDTKSFTRTIEGQFVRLFKDNFKESYTIVPSSITSKKKIYQTTKTNFKFSSIQQEFPINQNVLFCHPESRLCGAKGKVVGYSKDNRKVKVQILRYPRYSQAKFKQVLQILTTKTDIFFSLRFSAEIVGLKHDKLQTLLGTINVVTPKGSKLPPSIDIGLNFMSRREEMIVPNLVRINFYDDKQAKKEQPFKYLQLSVRALQIVIEYRKKFPEIFQFMEKRHDRLVQKAHQNNNGKIDWAEPINCEDIYPFDPQKSLMKVYMWLVEKEQTHMPVASIFSKQVQQKRIKRLQQLFTESRIRQQQQGPKKRKYAEANVETVDPNFLFSHKLSQLGTLYLRRKPQNHQIGDLVICVSPQFFGHYGAIIGIDDNKYEVLFDESSFGKTDLGGLCSNLWGGKLCFRELMNLSTWPQFFLQRVRASGFDERMGWIQNTDAFYPYYQSKPFQDFQDVKVFTAKVQNRKFFSEEMLAQISRVQTNLKQVDLDSDFTVVDNRKQDHRYKYNTKKLYIQKEQVEEGAKLAEVLDKQLNLGPVVKPTYVQKPVQVEIIENKIEESAGGEIGEEQDAHDILG